jgi:glycosyltransferase involved in cell wall biosynthesis
MIDIANALSVMNFDISLITGRLIVRDNPLGNTVKVRKIIKYDRSSKPMRLITWITAFFQILFIIKTKYRKDYLFIVTNPPFTPLLTLFCRNKFSLLIFDVYPDALIQTGIVGETSFLIKCWRKANKRVFSRADNIFTLTEGMSALLKNYSGEKKIQIMPIWTNNEFFRPIPKDLNPFISEQNLKDKFVVLYSGNLGATHNIEVFPELALRIKKQNVVFLIIGEGDRKKWLYDQVRKLDIRNCLLLPLQSVDLIPYSFASADLAVVSLDSTASGLSLPSKTFNFMSAGLPLLCISGNDSELKRLVTKYDNGKCFLPNQVEEMVSFIEEMSDNRIILEYYRTNSLKASKDFTPQNAVQIAVAIQKSFD